MIRQIEELKTSPNEPSGSAVDMVAQALDKELNAGTSGLTSSQVNDLTTMVKKKKKPAAEPAPAAEPVPNGTGGEKRKADDDAATPPEKKARLEEPGASA